jgi:hypothetical protein
MNKVDEIKITWSENVFPSGIISKNENKLLLFVHGKDGKELAHIANDKSIIISSTEEEFSEWIKTQDYLGASIGILLIEIIKLRRIVDGNLADSSPAS